MLLLIEYIKTINMYVFFIMFQTTIKLRVLNYVFGFEFYIDFYSSNIMIYRIPLVRKGGVLHTFHSF